MKTNQKTSRDTPGLPCPVCGTTVKLSLHDIMAMKDIKCPTCGHVFHIEKGVELSHP